MAEGKRSMLAATLAAADAVLAGGGPLTYGALARELGQPYRAVLLRVQSYRLRGKWTLEVCKLGRGAAPGRAGPESVAAIAAIAAIRARGERLTQPGLAAELGVSLQAAQSRLARLRALKKLGTVDPGLDLAIARAEPRPASDWDASACWDPGSEAVAAIEARRAEFDDRKRREAVDGREEVDDWRTVRAPRSRWEPAPVLPEREARELACGAMLAEWKEIRGRAR